MAIFCPFKTTKTIDLNRSRVAEEEAKEGRGEGGLSQPRIAEK